MHLKLLLLYFLVPGIFWTQLELCFRLLESLTSASADVLSVWFEMTKCLCDSRVIESSAESLLESV